jgi:hypothetical protein
MIKWESNVQYFTKSVSENIVEANFQIFFKDFECKVVCILFTAVINQCSRSFLMQMRKEENNN